MLYKLSAHAVQHTRIHSHTYAGWYSLKSLNVFQRMCQSRLCAARHLNWFNLKSLPCFSISIPFFALRGRHLTAFHLICIRSQVFYFLNEIKYSILKLWLNLCRIGESFLLCYLYFVKSCLSCSRAQCTARKKQQLANLSLQVFILLEQWWLIFFVTFGIYFH